MSEKTSVVFEEISVLRYSESNKVILEIMSDVCAVFQMSGVDSLLIKLSEDILTVYQDIFSKTLNL